MRLGSWSELWHREAQRPVKTVAHFLGAVSCENSACEARIDTWVRPRGRYPPMASTHMATHHAHPLISLDLGAFLGCENAQISAQKPRNEPRISPSSGQRKSMGESVTKPAGNERQTPQTDPLRTIKMVKILPPHGQFSHGTPPEKRVLLNRVLPNRVAAEPGLSAVSAR